ncbi:MAG: hypothetical protein ACP5I8_10375 [Phycisphaerae bacterium]
MTDIPDLPWTGERYLPGVEGHIELEHRHRYYLARRLAAGERGICQHGFDAFASDALVLRCRAGYGGSGLDG